MQDSTDASSVVEGTPEFVTKPENLEIEEGQTIKLKCQVKGKQCINFDMLFPAPCQFLLLPL